MASRVFIEYLKDRLTGKAPEGAKRSPLWFDVRKNHLRKNPRCVICGSTNKLQVHHVIPFHLAPDLELVPTNLITLCTRKKYGINCHLLVGHLGNFRRFNIEVRTDAKTWRSKLEVDPSDIGGTIGLQYDKRDI